MTLPLRWVPNTNIDFQELSDAQLARLSYDLRLMYATQLNNDEAGRILVGGGTNFGSAEDTIRTQGSATNPHSFPGASTGTSTVTTYTYGQSLPSTQATDYTNSYLYYNDISALEGEFAQATESAIVSGVLKIVYDEMRTGDELGTYRVAVTSPGSEWVDKGTWFTDTVYNNDVAAVTYKLWLKTSIPAADVPSNSGLTQVLGLNADGDFQEMAQSTLPNLLYAVMQNQLLKSATSPLRYSLGSGTNRGTFTNTQLSTTSSSNQQLGPDDYRSTATPSGGTTVTNSYYLGIN